MRRILTRLCLVSAVLALSPKPAAAGGSEFPAGGTRNLGRGGSGFTRADDPSLMLRNPALLADLWTDMAYTGVHVLVPDSCFQATGNYGWKSSGEDLVNFGDGPLLGNVSGAKRPDGTALPDLRNEAYPEVCYRGPLPVLPNVALTMKLAPNWGVGLGFFPPDTAALSQWGNRDGTVDTPNGLRPSPTRWFRAHLNTSYFSALGAIGYRPVSWLRVGFGFQWALLAYSTTEFTRTNTTRDVASDVRIDVNGRDLFVPGFVASVHATPIDALDIAIGFKWSDRVSSRAKLDITTGNFAAGEPLQYVDEDGALVTATGLRRFRNAGRYGDVSSPPIWVPQLSFGMRYAQRIAARPDNESWQRVRSANGRDVRDAMATERWDLEGNAIVYFNGASDESQFVADNQTVLLQAIREDGSIGSMSTVYVGQCVKSGSDSCARREVPSYLHGKTQYSLRVGGDYNLIAGILALRAGLSYETNGQDPVYLNVTNYQLGRTGLHVGATWRIAGQTDLSVGYAHFIQRRVALTVNDKSPFRTSDPQKFHVVTGNNDGMAQFAIGDAADNVEGPLFANAGTFYYHLDVVSLSLAQHF
jgi:hypothetical protein